jgi:hypothetical protein
MSEKLDVQLKAITTLVEVLEPLDATERSNVLDFVFRSLGISPPATSANLAKPPELSALPGTVTLSPHAPPRTGGADIGSFTREKNPSSANQMVAVMGYYLANLAPDGEKRDYIVPGDVKKYFVQGGFPLPSAPAVMTLVNAKNAGYLDALERGNYRLNAVGHNLVAHKLPASSNAASPRRSSGRKESAKKMR